MIPDSGIVELEKELESPRDLPYREVIPVMGIPVTFSSNDRDVIVQVDAAFGAWRALDAAPMWIEPSGPSLAFVVVDDREDGEGEGFEAHAPISYELPRADRLLVATPGSRAIADGSIDRAAARITRSLVADRDHFRYSVIESLTIFLLCDRDRQPLHAAALVRNETALLLAGPSGVGKSTLAYAGARAGLKVLAEDVVYLQRHPTARVWGMPGFIHLSPESTRWFPELSERRPTLQANGKLKVAVNMGEIGAVPRVPVAERVGICVLRRDGLDSGPRRLRPAELEAALLRRVESGFDRFADTIGAVLHETVGEGGGWRLDLPDSPALALELLLRMFEELDATRRR